MRLWINVESQGDGCEGTQGGATGEKDTYHVWVSAEVG